MKKMYYIEFCDSDYIYGDVYPLGEMTEKEALKVTEKRIKELYRNNRNIFNVSVNICLDSNALDMIYNISLWKGDITIYDYRTEEFVKDTVRNRINKLMSHNIHKINNNETAIR